jgi:hypothetical protein
MTVVRQKGLPRKAAGENQYGKDEKEVDEEGDWEVEECTAWRKVHKVVAGRGMSIVIGVGESAEV